jgi:hypothetical protein
MLEKRAHEMEVLEKDKVGILQVQRIIKWC